LYIHFHSLPLSSYKTSESQPIILDDFILLFNGEIFNHDELLRGSVSDVHYIKYTFKKLNKNIENFYKESLKWEGFWAICIIDKKNDIYFFTDPLGKKQLYFSKHGIASEIKELFNKNAIRKYDETDFGTLNTNFMEIDRALPGLLYCYLHETNYPFVKKKQDYFLEKPKLDLYECIDLNVKNRLHNKYDSISLLLSGGLDSNIVLHHALKYINNLEILSIENNESEIVYKRCKELGLNVKFIKDEISDEELDHALFHYENSLDYGSLIPNYLLFKNCSNSMVLTGDGADEIFGGYSRATLMDTWFYDVFKELPYYHNIRIDRMSMAFTKECRSPLMAIELVKHGKALKWENRKNKIALRSIYKGVLPDYITESVKKPLRFKDDKEMNKVIIKNKFNLIWKNQ
jgi:asparagine synthetase B (glutamine-hydrolysing)